MFKGKDGGGIRISGAWIVALLLLGGLLLFASSRGAQKTEVCTMCGQPTKTWVEVSFEAHGANVFSVSPALGERPIEGGKAIWRICAKCHEEAMASWRRIRQQKAAGGG